MKKDLNDYGDTLENLAIININVEPKDLAKNFMFRFEDAWEFIENKKVKRYIFSPSKRIVWVVEGKKGDYRVLPSSGYCECEDFFYHTIDSSVPCKHLIAFNLAVMLSDFRTIFLSDKEYEDYRNSWTNDYINSKNNNKVESIENIETHPRESNEPLYKATHAYRFTSKIPVETVQLFHEFLSEFVIKETPSPNDRAQQVHYRVPGLGRISLSRVSGTIVVDTDIPDPFHQLRSVIGKDLHKSLMNNKMQTSVGIHIPKIAFTSIPQTITTQIELIPGVKSPFTVTVRNTPKYIDVHTHHKFPKTESTPRVLPSNNYWIQESRHYIQSDEVLKYVREKGFIMINNAKELGIKPNALRYHLKKLTKQGFLIKEGNSPATFYPA